jgi:hypothetical protein
MSWLAMAGLLLAIAMVIGGAVGIGVPWPWSSFGFAPDAVTNYSICLVCEKNARPITAPRGLEWQ